VQQFEGVLHARARRVGAGELLGSQVETGGGQFLGDPLVERGVMALSAMVTLRGWLIHRT
jgi:hypothetical protein